MRKNTLYSSLLFIFLIITSSALATDYTGGDGSESNPYQISTLDQLKHLSETTADWDKHFILISDIDASSTSSWDSGKGFTPIGNETTKFTGSFNGKNFTISNLTISRGSLDHVGFFGYIDNSTIINVGMVDCNIGAKGETGVLVGVANYSVIDNCFATGGKVQTYSWGNVLGGLIGRSYNTTISYCHSDIEIICNNGYGGGLVGSAEKNSKMSFCYSLSPVSSNNTTVGHVYGGLVARVYSSSLENSYSFGSVQGNNHVGGLCGFNVDNGTISNSYSTGNVSCPDKAGGFLGYNKTNSIVVKCFYDEETSGQTGSIGEDDNSQSATAYKTSDFASEGNFAGWDFVDVWEIKTIETIDSEPHPYLQWQSGYKVNFVSGENGTINGNGNQLVKRAGDSEEVTAVANENYSFIEWQDAEGTSISTDNPIIVKNVKSNMTYNAIFSPLASVDEYDNNKIKIYPIPGNSLVNIESSDFVIDEVKVINLNGQELRKVKMTGNNNQLDISGLSKGEYFIQVSNSSKSVIKKIIIE
jgi:hypothetical protein